MTLKPWKIISELTMADAGPFTIRKSRRQNPRNKSEADYYLVDGVDWVNVVATDPDGNILLVKQYRHGISDFSIELPAGCLSSNNLNEDEVIAEAARELLEETGYSSNSYQYVGEVLANPAFLSQKSHIVRAIKCVKTNLQNLDLGEDIQVMLVSPTELLSLIEGKSPLHTLLISALKLLEIKKKEFLL